MKNEMLINVSQPEECRIAIVEDGMLEELYIERSSQDNYVGNVYKPLSLILALDVMVFCISVMWSPSTIGRLASTLQSTWRWGVVAIATAKWLMISITPLQATVTTTRQRATEATNPWN